MTALDDIAEIQKKLRPPPHEHEYVNISPPWHKDAFLLKCKICGHEVVDMTKEMWQDFVSNSFIE